MSENSPVNLNTSLSSLAMLSLRMSDGEDYLDYLYGFVIEALNQIKAPTFDAAKVHEVIKLEFGLRIPIATLVIYLKRLKTKKLIEMTPDGHQFRAVNLPTSSISGDRSAASGRISEALYALKEYAKTNHALDWSDEHTAGALTEFVREYSIAFVRHSEFRSPLPDPGPETASEHFVVSSFIRNSAESLTPVFESIKTLVESHILANALLCPDLKNKGTGYNGVVFVLDTRLLLKAFDLESMIDTESTRVLLDTIRRLKGVLCVLTETKDEIRSVLSGIRRGLQQGGARGPVVEELRKRGRGVADVILAESNLETNLKQLGVTTLSSPGYDQSTYRFQIDEAGLRAELEEELGYDLGKAADHDVHVVRSIFAFRRGRNVSRIEDAGHVFLTTNAALSRAAFSQQREENSGWVFSAVITDFHLSHLTWLKSPMESGDLSKTELLSNCYAAMHPPKKVWRSYLAEVDRLKCEGRFTEQDHEVLRLSLNAPEALMDVTRGEIDGITESNLREILSRIERNYAEEKQREIDRLQIEKERANEDLLQANRTNQQQEALLAEAVSHAEKLRQDKINQAAKLKELQERDDATSERETQRKEKVERLANLLATIAFVVAGLAFVVLGTISLFSNSNTLLAVPFVILGVLNLGTGFSGLLVKRYVRDWVAGKLSKFMSTDQ
ncbi:hypothetical protein JIN85_18485 [Luteolibacter pohnpeiensis]|uniref:Uncharacterized protein n=1 Tax=Luteolibacter pohnpeiensis TaxID=454153 RepID=A0A934S805_9BACT|nr:hypothetical protein [Luteolibacter pohnpeiensis]MBK1884411.1 hypothetical protein [Luteolibacter pohnpeiensis]